MFIVTAHPRTALQRSAMWSVLSHSAPLEPDKLQDCVAINIWSPPGLKHVPATHTVTLLQNVLAMIQGLVLYS